MVSAGLIVFLGIGALLLGLGLRGYLAPAAGEAGVVIDDLRGLKAKLAKKDVKGGAEKGEREGGGE